MAAIRDVAEAGRPVRQRGLPQGAVPDRALMYRPSDLIALGTELLQHAGLAVEKARPVAEIVVEGELLGKSTHGFALLPRYVRELQEDRMTKEGEPEVIHDLGAVLAWDARKLPGPYVVVRAMDEAMARAKQFGIGAVTFQRSHHLAALGAFLKRATDQGFLMLLTLTDPGHSGVAPYGGITPVLTSNPIAFGAPTNGAPILIDTTTSLQSNGMAALYRTTGERFERPDLMDNQGRATNDPAVIVTDPPGSILPLGGMMDGHKGSAISLMVELLTGCLSGRGRADPFEGWAAAAFLLMIDPQSFGGRADYLRQVDRLVEMIHGSKPREGFDRVRLPGEIGLEMRERQLEEGIAVPASLMEEIAGQAASYSLVMPDPL